MDASRHGAMRTSFEIHGFFERQPGGEFSLRGGTQGGCPLAATKRLLALDTVYPLHSKGAERWGVDDMMERATCQGEALRLRRARLTLEARDCIILSVKRLPIKITCQILKKCVN